MEKEAIEKVFCEMGNVDVEVYTTDECTYELFKEKYSSNDFDMIWLACHGTFNYDNPTKSLLTISRDKDISLDDLMDLVPTNRDRRLLIINACQSGCSSIRYAGMNFIGFGSSLASEYQSVIGNLWPIDSFAAAIFGALLSYYIFISESWEEATSRARKQMQLGNESVIKVFRDNIKFDSNISLYNRLSNYEESLSKMIYWSSPTLFK